MLLLDGESFARISARARISSEGGAILSIDTQVGFTNPCLLMLSIFTVHLLNVQIK